jgi:hypothetical protein
MIFAFRSVGTRAARVRTPTGCRVLRAPASERNFIWSVIVPADGTRTAIVGSGDFGTSPLYFGQLSGKPLLLPVSGEVGSRT